MHKARLYEAENEVDNQASGMDAQSYKDDPGYDLQTGKYELVTF